MPTSKPSRPTRVSAPIWALRRAGSVALLLVSTVLISAQGSNLVQNPSFESDFQNWEASGNQAIRTNDVNYPPSDGNAVVGFNLNGAPATAVLSQTVATTPGQRYSLAFDLGTVFAIADQRMRVTIAGNGVLLDETIEVAGLNAGPFHIPQRLSFVANSASSTITFEDESFTYVVIDSFLDNIRVTSQNAQAPVITTQPARTAVAVGQDATFSVVASGNNMSYQWQFNGASIGGATGSSYTVTSVSAYDAGNYTVVVSNGSGSTSSSAATLTVLPQAILLNGSFEYRLGGLDLQQLQRVDVDEHLFRRHQRNAARPLQLGPATARRSPVANIPDGRRAGVQARF